jgi:hypothetical protein
MNILDVIRIDRDRLTSPFNRLVITLQSEISPRLAAIETGERRIVRARQNRLVEIFKAFCVGAVSSEAIPAGSSTQPSGFTRRLRARVILNSAFFAMPSQ